MRIPVQTLRHWRFSNGPPPGSKHLNVGWRDLPAEVRRMASPTLSQASGAPPSRQPRPRDCAVPISSGHARRGSRRYATRPRAASRSTRCRVPGAQVRRSRIRGASACPAAARRRPPEAPPRPPRRRASPRLPRRPRSCAVRAAAPRSTLLERSRQALSRGTSPGPLPPHGRGGRPYRRRRIPRHSQRRESGERDTAVRNVAHSGEGVHPFEKPCPPTTVRPRFDSARPR